MLSKTAIGLDHGGTVLNSILETGAGEMAVGKGLAALVEDQDLVPNIRMVVQNCL